MVVVVEERQAKDDHNQTTITGKETTQVGSTVDSKEGKGIVQRSSTVYDSEHSGKQGHVRTVRENETVRRAI
jgi:uncharacterized Fe-S center protein